MMPDKNNPFTCEEVYDNLQKQLKEFIDEGKVKVMIIPDIESVNYGRDVGYSITEHKFDKDVEDISATEIRRQIGIEKS